MESDSSLAWAAGHLRIWSASLVALFSPMPGRRWRFFTTLLRAGGMDPGMELRKAPAS